jgi:hypothetical protein
LFGLVILLAIACVLYQDLAPAFFRLKSLADFLLLSLVAAPFVLVLGLMFRSFFQGAFGTEEVNVDHDTLVWIRKALWWTRRVEVRRNSITGILARTPWHGRKNHVDSPRTVENTQSATDF